MNLLYIVCAIIIVVLAFFQFNHMKKRKQISDELVTLVTSKKFNEVYQKIDDPSIKRFIPQFNLYFLGMNAALIENNTTKINMYFDHLSSLKLNESQKKAVFMKGLQYFITSKDSKRCEVCYKSLITLEMDENTKEYLEEINSVMILKQSDKLDEILARINANKSGVVFADEFLVSEIYNNLGNKVESERFSNLAKNHLDEFIKENKQV